MIGTLGRTMLFGTALALAGAGALAYQVKGYSWSYQPAPTGEPLTMCTKTAPAGAGPIIRKAAQAWGYGKFKFTFAADACLANSPAHVDDGVNYIDFGPIGTDLAATESRNEPGTNRSSECDIRFNTAKSWYVGEGTPPAGRPDLLSTAMHELGHCLGLDEGDVPNTVMDPVLLPGKTRRTLQPDDLAGRNMLYGKP